MCSITFRKFALLVCLLFPASVLAVTCPAGPPCGDLNTQFKGARLPSWGVDSGTANAYAITTMGGIGSGEVLQTGDRFYFIATHANTTASTLAVNGGSAKAIKKNVSTALASGDILLNGLVEVVYDGTNFQMLGPGTTNISLPLSVANGGTGLGTLTAHAVLLGEGTSNVAFAPVVGTGKCLMDNGLSSDPTFQTCGGGSSASTIQSNSLKGNTVTTGSITSGHLVVVGIDSDNGSVDPPVLSSTRVSSWTLACKSVANSNKAWLFYGIATSSGTDSISSTVAGSFSGTSYLEVSGANAIKDACNGVYSNVAGISSTFSTTFLNDVVVSFWAGWHVGECVTAVSPMVIQSSACGAPADPLAIASFFTTSAGSQTAAFNSTGGLDDNQVMLTAAFTSSNSAVGVAPFYQTVQEAGTARTQRPTLNFDADLTCTDNSGNTSTDCDLSTTGVGAGSCGDATHSCGLTYDSKGRITAASNNTITGSGGSANSGPALGAFVCSSSQSGNGPFTCAARFAVVTGKVLVAICTDFTNGAGAGAPAFSDTLSNTWTQVATVFQAGNSRQVTAWWSNPSTGGSDTFTCSNSVTISFGGMSVSEVSGATTAGPVDATTSTTGNNSSFDLKLTTVAAGDLMFVGYEYGGTLTDAFPTSPTPFFNILADGAQAVVTRWRDTKNPGDYYVQGNISGNYAILAFGIK